MRLRYVLPLILILFLSYSAVRSIGINAASAPIAAQQSGNVLASTAASMQPGTWAVLTTSNINPTLGPTFGGSSNNVLAEGPEMQWDPTSQQVFFFGSDHCDLSQFISYDAKTNTWQRLARGAWMPSSSSYCKGMTHGEDGSAIDQARGVFYYDQHLLTKKVHRYNIATQTWTDLPTVNDSGWTDPTLGVDYFPEMRSLIMVNGGGYPANNNKMYIYSEDTGQWKTPIALGQTWGDTATYRNFVRYNPVHKVVVFSVRGFGDRRLWKMDSAGTITRLRDAPIGLGIMCPCIQDSVIFIADPVSGDYIVINKSREMWRYDVGADTWTKLSVTIPSAVFTNAVSEGGPNPIFGVSVATITTYGVQMFTSCDGSNCRVHLFKYAAGSPPPPPPSDTTPPTASISSPGTGATVSSTVTVSANASDNAGVAGVQFKLDGQNLGAEDTSSPYSMSWNTASAINGSHNLTAVARDSAGNQATSSAAGVTVNNSAPSFDFALANGGNRTAIRGQAASNTITSTLSSGSAQSVSFSASGQPSGTTIAFSAASCSPTCTSTLTLTTSSTTPVGSYTITVTGTAGSLSHTTAFSLTVSAASGPSTYDFQALCGQAGVLRCVGFDAAADIAGTYGDNHGTLPGDSTPQLDSSVKASGASSLKFTIPSNSNANSSGSYFTNFSDDLQTQFGENREFYVQWRQRFSPEFIGTVYAGGGGWKQAILGTGDKPGCSSTANTSGGLCYSSCTALETVTQNVATRGFAQMYNSCSGSTSHGPYDPFHESFGTYDYKLQNAQPSPYCLYSQGQTSYFPPQGNCFGYFANEWMTFQVHIKTGPRVNDEFKNSYVQLSIAREGQPGQLVLNWGPYNLTAGDPATNQMYGKVWLLPYNTGKSASVSYPTAYTWYDDLIISTQPISMGGGTSTDTTQPAVSISSPTSGSTVSGTTTVSATATDNVGVAGVQFLLDGVNLGAEDTTAPYSTSWNTTTASAGSHTLTAMARDTAGNRTTSSAVAVTVSNTTSDTTPPAVSITSPASGGMVSGTVTVAANASDNTVVAGVQFRLDGTNLGAEDTTAPYSVSWSTASATNGSHSLTAVARDAAGNQGTSATVAVTVTNDTTSPVISGAASSSVTTTSATINWTTNEASDSQVEYGLTTSYGSQTTLAAAAVTAHSQAISGLTAGTTYNYHVKSKDAAGNLAVSGNFTFTTTASSGGRTIDIFPGTNVFGPAAQSLLAGDTLIVHQGTYTETNRMSLRLTGTSSAPIIITGAGGEAKPIITRPATAAVQNTINIEGSASYLTIRGLEIAGNGGDGVNMSGSGTSYITLEDLVIHDIDVGVNFKASMNNIIVRHNHIYNTGINSGTGEGMYVGCNDAACIVRDSLIEQNWIHDALPGTTQGDGIEVKFGSHSNIVRDNVIYNRPYPGIFVYGTLSNPVNIVEGNVVWNALEGIYAVSDAIVRNNIVFNSGTGLSLYGHAQVPQMKNVTAVNNTLYNNNDGIYMRWSSSAVNMVLANNAIYSAGKRALNTSGSAGTFAANYVEGTADRTLDGTAFINGGTSTNAFGDPVNGNFWLKAGSPLLNMAGGGYAPATDFNQTPRVSPYDVGAYETNGAATNPGWTVTPGFKSGSTASSDTTPPTIAGVTASSITPSGAAITWSTNEASDSQIEYGTTTSYGSQTTLAGSQVTAHSQAISGLSANTTYNYRVKSRDAAGNLATSANFTFTTGAALDTTAPSITTVAASGITLNGATVSWSTNEASNSQVEYGTTTSYGSQTTLNSSQVTAHSQALSGLLAGTTYNYRVKSRDAAGNLATSGNFTFTTTTAADTTPPTITSVTASGITASGATITWTTNEASDTQVEYGTTTSYGSQTTLNTSKLTAHSQTLSGLAAGVTYNYRVKSRDAAGNIGISGNFTFTTTAVSAGTGLIGSWSFNEGAGATTLDASGRGNNGTLSNNPTWVTGAMGAGLQFSATDNSNDKDDPRVVIGRNFDVTSLPMTLSAWVKPDNFQDYRAIFSKRDGTSDSKIRFDLGLQKGTGTVYLYTGVSKLVFNVGPAINTWTHITVVATTSSTSLYVNGVLKQTLAAVRLGSGAAANTVIGGTGEAAGGDNDPFKGSIDEVRVYNRALSATEVQQIFASRP